MSDFAQTIAAAYAADGPALDLGRGVHDGAVVPEAVVKLPLAMANRHGLIAGGDGDRQDQDAAGDGRAARPRGFRCSSPTSRATCPAWPWPERSTAPSPSVPPSSNDVHPDRVRGGVPRARRARTGDPRPRHRLGLRAAFFFDEAHLLFDGATPAFLDSIAQTVRLIRSKGVGIYFVTQTPKDVPGEVLGQLGNRVQHALRAFTPDDAKALKATVSTFPKSEFYDHARPVRAVEEAAPRRERQ